ncbi:RraA family protein [Inquilinus sp. OTU3971]|uniref:RraA family protein n=1 Tax=Inquilinus sp. OTU3971 TaxID=3043855 RepID=UPI00313B394A
MASADDALVTLREMPTATIYEAAGKLGDMAPSIRLLTPGLRMAGSAFTVKTMPGDSLAVLRAIATAPAGSVLVIDGGGTDRSTVWGGTSTIAAMVRGIAGLVTNGAIRDIDEIRSLGFPVFGAGLSLRGTVKAHPGWDRLPVSVGGVVVCPGDLVVGDSDGVVVVASARLADVALRAVEQKQLENARDLRIRAGADLREVLELPIAG